MDKYNYHQSEEQSENPFTEDTNDEGDVHLEACKPLYSDIEHELENADLGQPLSLIYFDDKEGYKITEEGTELLQNLNENIGVIAVAGKYRTGKSYLLNKIILQNNSNSGGFGVGPTINPCTKGLWVWSKPIITKYKQKDLKVLVIDSEGIGALNEDANHDTRIFLLALLISSYFIFNSMGTIDESALQNISLIINLSKEIQVKERELNTNTEEIPKYFPSFLWVVRDFTLRLVDSHGSEITSSEYLEKALELQKGTSDSTENKNKIRRMIKHFFPKRDCVTLVRPVEGEKMLQNLNQMPEDELRPLFVKQLKSVQDKIRKKVEPKMLNGKILNGPMLLELCKSYLNAINKGNVPCIENAWNYVLKYEAEKLMNSLVKEYTQCIDSLLPEDTEESLLSLLSEIHSEITPSIIEKFQSNVIEEDSRELQLQLCEKIDFAYSKFYKTCEIKEQTKSRTFLAKHRESIERKLRKFQIKSMPAFNKELSTLKEQFELKFPNFSSENSAKIWHSGTEKLILKAGDYISKAISEKAKEESGLLRAKLQNLQTLYEKTSLDLEQERAQKTKEMREIEKRNSTLKSTIKVIEEKMQMTESHKSKEVEKLKSEMAEAEQQLQHKYQQLQLDNEQLQQENEKLKMNNEKLRDEKYRLQEKTQKFNSQLQETREKNYQEIQDLNDRYEQKLKNLNSIGDQKQKIHKESITPEFTKFFEKQAEENSSLKKCIQDLLNQKNAESISADEAEIQELRQKVEALTERSSKFEKKYKEAKVYYRLFRHCSLIQCKYCNKYYKQAAFMTHSQSCSLSQIIPKQKETLSNIEICITQTLIREDENIKKPFTMYVIETTLGEENWMIQRKYKEFCSLNEKLVRFFPTVELPESASQFFNKCLEDLLKKKRTMVVEQRRKNLEKYLNDLAKIAVIRDSTYFTEFIGYQNEEGHTHVLKEIGTKSVNLESTRMDQIAARYTS
ncbi:unnamed protein product [Moneuplotes crassus]|uniref:GB1/RHD3-type G domain-containing protein n=1 Tax=Euplotes crassus TaxID=5936 RepID=A0AAD1XXI8_EUPCR|nr:unnamed protein product [Moneuplotes crassus]